MHSRISSRIWFTYHKMHFSQQQTIALIHLFSCKALLLALFTLINGINNYVHYTMNCGVTLAQD